MADTLEEITYKNFSTNEIMAGTAHTFTTNANTAFVIKDINIAQKTGAEVTMSLRLAETSEYNAGRYYDLGTIGGAGNAGAEGSLIMPPNHTLAIVPTPQTIAYTDLYLSHWTTARYSQGLVPQINGVIEPTLISKPYNELNFSSAGYQNFNDSFGYNYPQGELMAFVAGVTGANAGNATMIRSFADNNYNNSRKYIVNFPNGSSPIDRTQYYSNLMWDGERYLFFSDGGNGTKINITDFTASSNINTYTNLRQVTHSDSIVVSPGVTSYARTVGCNMPNNRYFVLETNGRQPSSTEVIGSIINKSNIPTTDGGQHTLPTGSTYYIIGPNAAASDSSTRNGSYWFNAHSPSQSYFYVTYHSRTDRIIMMLQSTGSSDMYFMDWPADTGPGLTVSNAGGSLTRTSDLTDVLGWDSSLFANDSGAGYFNRSVINNLSGVSVQSTTTFNLVEDDIFYLNENGSFHQICKFNLQTGTNTVMADYQNETYVGWNSNPNRDAYQAFAVYPNSTTINSRNYTQAPFARASVYGIKETR